MPHLNHVHDGGPGMPDGENVLDLNPHPGFLGSLVDDLPHGRAEDGQLDDQPRELVILDAEVLQDALDEVDVGLPVDEGLVEERVS